MHKLSDEAAALMATLANRGTSAWAGDDRGPVYARLAQLDEVALIPSLASMLYNGDARDKRSAAAIISKLLPILPLADLPQLDEWMRRSWRLEWERWSNRNRQSAEIVDTALTGAAPLQLSSMHPNGYVREEAVRRLRLVQDGSELPYLLLRLNDWVPSVRAVAREAVFERIVPERIGAYISSFALIERLRVQRRNNHTETLQRIDELLRTPEARPCLIAGLQDSDKRVRRLCLRALSTAGVEDQQVISLALSSDDPAVRAQGVSWLARGSGTPFSQAHLESALHDRFLFVRQATLRALVALFPDTASSYLQSALFDQSASMRSTARFHLSGLAGSDIRKIYLDALVDPDLKRLPAVVAGLGEAGCREDLPRLSQYLLDPNPRVRWSAVYAAAKLGDEQQLRALLPLVGDASPSVSKLSLRVLKPQAYALGGEALSAVAKSSSLSHVARNALLLIAELPRWDAILFLLRAGHARNTQLSSFLEMLIDHWCDGTSYLSPRPTAEQRALVLAKLGIIGDDGCLQRPFKRVLNLL